MGKYQFREAQQAAMIRVPVYLFILVVFIVSLAARGETPTEAELRNLEEQIRNQEAELEREKQRTAEEARRNAEAQKLREEQARLEEERRKLEEERRKIEDARKAEIDRQRREEEARLQAIEEQKRREEEAKKAVVTLVFYRNQSYPFGGDSAIITHNGREIGKLSSKSYFIYQSPPGSQHFNARIFGDWTVERTFDFQPGSTNFLNTAIDWSTVDITMTANGPEAITGLENSGSLDPRQFFSNFDEAVKKSNDSSGARSNPVFGR